MKPHAVFILALLAFPAASASGQGPTRIKASMDRIVAVVGTQPILWSDVLEVINQKRAQGAPIPEDSLGALQFARQVVSDLVDEEVMVQRARVDTSIVVADADVATTVEGQLKKLRDLYKTDEEYIGALKSAGFGNPEEYRRWLTEQSRRRALTQRLMQKMQQSGKMISVAVTEDEITESFERTKAQLPKRPSAITFRQIVLPTVASEAARKVARTRAESLFAEINRGGDFEVVAKRESQDAGSKDQGGDLGWNRRGAMVAQFEEMMFALSPGKVGPIVETVYGYHIIRVDRVKPGEVKARHILIKPAFDSTDTERTRKLADSVLTRWKAGAPYDSLAPKFHDPDELSGSLEPFPREQLPESYKAALKDLRGGDFFGPFSIEDKQKSVPKFVIGQILTSLDAGDYTAKDLHDQIRDQLQQEKSFRRFIDTLKKETYVSIRIAAL